METAVLELGISLPLRAFAEGVLKIETELTGMIKRLESERKQGQSAGLQ